MPKELKRLPFDERNEQDFDDLTQRILDGLETIRKNRAIPATQEELAGLAVCTRKTLHNRVWPITELKTIKEKRKAKKDDKPKKITAEHRLSAEIHIEREELLIGQIRNYQKQNGELFEQVQDLEEQVAVLTTTTKVLEDEINSLKDEKRKLESEVCRLKKHDGKTNVVSISALKNS